MKNIGVILIISAFLGGCTTYWAFPPGKTKVDFDRDERNCFLTAFSMTACLQAKGYRQITQEDYGRINQEALNALSKPFDIVAYDVRTGELFVGKSTPAPGSNTSSIEIKGITSDISCTGYAEVTKIVPGGKGSLGVGELLCRDGRKIISEFVYETLRAGYGRGADSMKNFYRFIFGDLDIDPDALRARFKELLKKEKQKKEKLKKEKAA